MARAIKWPILFDQYVLATNSDQVILPIDIFVYILEIVISIRTKIRKGILRMVIWIILYEMRLPLQRTWIKILFNIL